MIKEQTGEITIGAEGSTWRGTNAKPKYRRTQFEKWTPNVERLFDVLRARQLDGLVVRLRTNVFYMAGMVARAGDSRQESDSNSAIVISTAEPEHPIMITNALDFGHFVVHPTWIEDIRPYIPFILSPDIPINLDALHRFVPTSARKTPWGINAEGKLSEGGFASLCQRALADLGLTKGRVGFDDLGFANGVAGPDVTVLDAYTTVKYIRQAKTAEEVRRLERAGALNTEAIQNTINSWVKGMTWAEMCHVYDLNAVALGGFVQREGGLALANDEDPDPRVFHNISDPEDFVVEEGMSMLLDCHGSLDFYKWDGGKTWVVDDERTGDAATIQKACQEASLVVMDGLRPGVSVHELIRKGTEVFQKVGAAEPDRALVFFHGIGLDHSDIDIRGTSARPDWVCEENMTVSTHIAYPGSRAERFYIEDAGIVTRNGGRSLYGWGVDPYERT